MGLFYYNYQPGDPYPYRYRPSQLAVGLSGLTIFLILGFIWKGYTDSLARLIPLVLVSMLVVIIDMVHFYLRRYGELSGSEAVELAGCLTFFLFLFGVLVVVFLFYTYIWPTLAGLIGWYR